MTPEMPLGSAAAAAPAISAIVTHHVSRSMFAPFASGKTTSRYLDALRRAAARQDSRFFIAALEASAQARGSALSFGIDATLRLASAFTDPCPVPR
jgi:hypothetical protein